MREGEPEGDGRAAALAAQGAALAAAGRAIADEATALLADAFTVVLADEAALAALDPRSARDAVTLLVRLGRMSAAEGESLVRKARGAAGR